MCLIIVYIWVLVLLNRYKEKSSVEIGVRTPFYMLYHQIALSYYVQWIVFCFCDFMENRLCNPLRLLCEKRPHTEFSWSVFSRIRTEYEKY